MKLKMYIHIQFWVLFILLLITFSTLYYYVENIQLIYKLSNKQEKTTEFVIYLKEQDKELKRLAVRFLATENLIYLKKYNKLLSLRLGTTP